MLIRLLLLGLLVWGLRRLLWGYPRAPAGARVLSGREWAFVDAASDAMFPPGGAIPPSGREAGVAAYVDDWVATLPSNIRLLMRMLFLLVEQATLLLAAPGRGGRARFSSLSEEQRVAVLEGWRASGFFPRRLVFTSLRAMLSMGYLADPAVLRHLELAPFEIASPVLDPDLLYPPVGKPCSEVRYCEADRTAPSDGTPLALDGPLHPAYRATDR